METVKLAALFIIFIMVFSAVASFIVMVIWTDKIEDGKPKLMMVLWNFKK